MPVDIAETSDIQLPGPGEAMACAQHARQQSVRPAGTAPYAPTIALLEVPEPWPKPAVSHPGFSGVLSELASSKLNKEVKLLAGWPHDAGSSHEPRLHVWRSARSEEEGAWFVAPYLRCSTAISSVGNLGEEIVRQVRMPVREFVAKAEADIVVLMCTQGSHDTCCGERGAELMDAMSWPQGVDVFRVSHMGGHRFAPTAITLPDARAWAYLNSDVLAGVLLDRLGEADIRSHLRGHCGLPTGPLQSAYVETVAQGIHRGPETLRLTMTAQQDHAVVSVEGPEGTTLNEVGRGRSVPVIGCNTDGGLPLKQAFEWIVGQPGSSSPFSVSA